MADKVVLRKRGDTHVWVADWTDPATGKRKQHTVESEDAGWARINAFRQEALIKADQEQRSGVKQPPKAVTTRLTVKQAFDNSWLKRWKGTAGAAGVESTYRRIAEFFGPNTELTAISAIWFDQWREQMLQQGKNPKTVNKNTSVLRSMAKDAIKFGKLIDTPTWPDNLSETRIDPRWLSDDEIQALRNFFRIRAKASPASSWAEMEDVFVLRLCQMTRSGETLRLTPRDVLGSDVIFRKTKTGKPRTVPIIDESMEILRRRCHGKKPDELLFNISIDRYTTNFRTAVRALQLPGRVTGGISRGTGATRATNRGVPLPITQGMGGWTTLTGIAHYAHCDTQSLQVMREALKGIAGS